MPMLIRPMLELYDLLDSPTACGAAVADYLRRLHGDMTVETAAVGQPGRTTDFVRITLPGTRGALSGGDAPTLGIVGRLGGIGARPAVTGFVSDGDGALAALTAAAKLADMAAKGDRLCGDVRIATHVCPHAPVVPHDPVPFMDSPVDMATMNREEIFAPVDALLTIDTTRGNRVINHRGIAISNTVKSGYILRVSDDLISLVETVTGELAHVFPLATQDITPYGNGLTHLNSILQPATATDAPVVGVALTAQTAVAGCATGATQAADVECAARFSVEVAKAFTSGKCRFYDPAEYERLVRLYGSMAHLQGPGR